jgi:hypothetical protein
MTRCFTLPGAGSLAGVSAKCELHVAKLYLKAQAVCHSNAQSNMPWAGVRGKIELPGNQALMQRISVKRCGYASLATILFAGIGPATLYCVFTLRMCCKHEFEYGHVYFFARVPSESAGTPPGRRRCNTCSWHVPWRGRAACREQQLINGDVHCLA